MGLSASEVGEVDGEAEEANHRQAESQGHDGNVIENISAESWQLSVGRGEQTLQKEFTEDHIGDILMSY